MSMNAAFRIGLQLPETERLVRWPELREMAIRAESLGFDTLWVGDHLLYQPASGPPRGPWEAWSTLGALAAVTTRVKLGPMVASTSFHAPAMLAKKASTIDEISNGRLIVGLGAGWNEPDYTAFGFPFDHRVSRFEEAFTIIRRLLSGETVSFKGEYYEIEESVLLPESTRTGRVPLLIGSIGKRMLTMTLPWVDIWNAWYDDFANDSASFRELNKQISARCEDVGRDPAALIRSASVLVQVAGGMGRQTLYSDGEQARAISGSAREVAYQLNAFREAGAQSLEIVLDPISLKGIEAFAPVLEELRS